VSWGSEKRVKKSVENARKGRKTIKYHYVVVRINMIVCKVNCCLVSAHCGGAVGRADCSVPGER